MKTSFLDQSWRKDKISGLSALDKRTNYAQLWLFFVTLIMQSSTRLLLFLLFSVSVAGQTNLNLNNSISFETVKIMTQKANQSKLDISTIKGSPYFNDQFSEAKIEREGEEATARLWLRYNGYNDEIEIAKKPSQKTADEALLKEKNIRATFDGKAYQYNQFRSKTGKKEEGYLVLVHPGKEYLLYTREQKVLTEGRKATSSLDKDIPPRFIEATTYYLKKEGDIPQEFDLKTKSIRAYLSPNHQAKLDQLKKQFRRIRTADALIELFQKLEE